METRLEDFTLPMIVEYVGSNRGVHAGIKGRVLELEGRPSALVRAQNGDASPLAVL